MTREAFVNWAAANHPKIEIRSLAQSGEAPIKGTRAYIALNAERCNSIEDAIIAGKYVPDNVLAEYPELTFWQILGR